MSCDSYSFGGKGDWLETVLGAKVFGKPVTGYVSLQNGVSRAVVNVPAIPERASLGELSSFFAFASGVAVRGACTRAEADDDGEITPTVVTRSIAPLPVSVPDKEPFDDSPAGRELNALDKVVRERSRNTCTEEFSSDGYCYLSILEKEHHMEAKNLLGSFPKFSTLCMLPFEWYLPTQSLSKVGVSLRRKVLHFEKGYGEGSMSVLDLLIVSWRRAAEGNPIEALYDISVGSPECEVDCRATTLKALKCKSIAACGTTVGELLSGASGDNLLSAASALRDGRSTLRKLGGTVELSVGEWVDDALANQGRQLCACWHDVEPPDGKMACIGCGFIVKSEDHEARCGKRSLSVPSYEGKSREWLGDAVHVLDVRAALLDELGYASADCQVEFTSAPAQRKYLERHKGLSFGSDSAGSSWFEDNYLFFRDDYVRTYLVPEVKAIGRKGVGINWRPETRVVSAFKQFLVPEDPGGKVGWRAYINDGAVCSCDFDVAADAAVSRMLCRKHCIVDVDDLDCLTDKEFFRPFFRKVPIGAMDWWADSTVKVIRSFLTVDMSVDDVDGRMRERIRRLLCDKDLDGDRVMAGIVQFMLSHDVCESRVRGFIMDQFVTG